MSFHQSVLFKSSTTSKFNMSQLNRKIISHDSLQKLNPNRLLESVGNGLRANPQHLIHKDNHAHTQTVMVYGTAPNPLCFSTRSGNSTIQFKLPPISDFVAEEIYFTGVLTEGTNTGNSTVTPGFTEGLVDYDKGYEWLFGGNSLINVPALGSLIDTATSLSLIEYERLSEGLNHTGALDPSEAPALAQGQSRVFVLPIKPFWPEKEGFPLGVLVQRNLEIVLQINPQNNVYSATNSGTLITDTSKLRLIIKGRKLLHRNSEKELVDNWLNRAWTIDGYVIAKASTKITLPEKGESPSQQLTNLNGKEVVGLYHIFHQDRLTGVGTTNYWNFEKLSSLGSVVVRDTSNNMLFQTDKTSIFYQKNILGVQAFGDSILPNTKIIPTLHDSDFQKYLHGEEPLASRRYNGTEMVTIWDSGLTGPSATGYLNVVAQIPIHLKMTNYDRVERIDDVIY